jgi:hypothetical protein
MKIKFLLRGIVLLAVFGAGLAQAAEPSLICVDPLIKVFCGSTNLPVATAEAHAAIGEYATIQFVFRSPVAVKNLSAQVGGAPGAMTRFVGYVKVGKPGWRPDLSSPDGLFPDPLLEDGSINVAANENQPVWITVPARGPGVMRGTLTLRWSGGTASRSFTVQVHPVTMKKPRLWITNWWGYGAEWISMLAGHKVEPYSDEYWKLIREIARFMAQYHQNMVLVPPLDFVQMTQNNGTWKFDFSRFDKVVRTFIEAGVVGRIEGGHFGWRISETPWDSPFVVRVPGSTEQPATNAAARAFYGQFLPALNRHLKDRGWDKIYWQHLADEPVDGNAASYRQIVDMLHEFAPGMRVIEATQGREFVGAVNIWVPILDHLHKNYDFFRQRQKAGDEVWTYTCCGPGAPYANRFIEQQLLKPRLLHWINFRYGVTGYLHWGFDHWERGHSPFDETTFRWPAGDQWIVYPHAGKLLSSIRLEAMRDGINDHELLSMLSEKNRPLAQRLAEETILDFDRYDTDIAHFRARRLEILHALSNQPPKNR